jgi:hypothetical protein
VQIRATATDNDVVQYVDIYLDNAFQYRDSIPPYGYVWYTDAFANGAHTITAKGYDRVPNVGTDRITVTVDNQDVPGPPTPVTILSVDGITNLRAVLTWTPNTDLDFQKYEILYSTDPNFPPAATWSYAILLEQTVTTYAVVGLQGATTYYFRVRVHDRTDLWSDSNTFPATTLPNDPQKVLQFDYSQWKPQGRIVETGPDQRSVTQEFDELDRPEKLTFHRPDLMNVDLEVGYGYDNRFHCTQLTAGVAGQPPAQTVGYGYNALGQLETVTAGNPPVTVATYTYDVTGRWSRRPWATGW